MKLFSKKDRTKQITLQLLSNGDAPENTIYFVKKNDSVLTNSIATLESEARLFYDREVAIAQGHKFETNVLNVTIIRLSSK